MSGIAIAVVGKTKSGKTTFVRDSLVSQIADPERLYIYDIGNEYGQGITEDWADWMAGLENVKNSFVIIEEATINLSPRSDFQPVTRLMTRKRHDGNTIVLVFHSLYRVPPNLIHWIDEWYIFRTLDNTQKVRDKFADMPHIMAAYYKSKEIPKHECVRAVEPGLDD